MGGSKVPSKALPWGPESTPRAQKQGPRAIPNDSGVGQKSTNKLKISRNVSVPDVSSHCLFAVEFWPTRESFGMARGPPFWALGLDSGPREGAFEGMLDPPEIIKHIDSYWCPNGALLAPYWRPIGAQTAPTLAPVAGRAWGFILHMAMLT